MKQMSYSNFMSENIRYNERFKHVNKVSITMCFKDFRFSLFRPHYFAVHIKYNKFNSNSLTFFCSVQKGGRVGEPEGDGVNKGG